MTEKLAPEAVCDTTGSDNDCDGKRLWLEHVSLFQYRNYTNVRIEAGPGPVVLVGENGVGKTNFLEALSLLAPGRGLRNAQLSDMGCVNGGGDWSVAARVHTAFGAVNIGTGIRSAGGQGGAGERPQRTVRIDGDSRVSSGVLADYVDMVWLTPAMDGLFTGPTAERRRFLDRFVLCFDPGHRSIAGQFERAMQQRNRLLADGARDRHMFAGLEQVMAEAGVALAAARREAVAAMQGVIDARRARDSCSPFPWASVGLDGQLESDLEGHPAVDVEDRYLDRLASMRERDRGAGRTLDGPHRTDFIVAHGPKDMAARLCSTGEQKALLLGLVLAHAELVRQRRDGLAPILLLDEVTAHLDARRRHALFEDVLNLEAQVWMTGTDREAFNSLGAGARILTITNSEIVIA